MIRPISREQFEEAGRGEKFTRYFINFCDAIKGWGCAHGKFIDDKLAGAVVLKIPIRHVICANLKLLQTFEKYKGLGVGAELCEWAVKAAWEEKAQYFRVSCNPKAIGFYSRIGFKFWGEQRSGCLLSIFKIGGPLISDAIYDRDEYIEKCLTKGNQGSCVEIYDRPS